MSKVLFIVALILVAGYAYSVPTFEELSSLWESWKIQNQKSYHFEEEGLKFSIFADNYNKILKFNEENDTPRLGLNKFADLTGPQFKAQQASCAFVNYDEEFVAEHTTPLNDVNALPATVDWRSKGAVTPIKDQGQCGSCWTFSTTGVLEGNYFIQHGQLLSFSEQQIVDCDTTQDQGCDGGWPYLAVQYASEKGLELESDYPYKAVDGTCKYDQSKTHTVSKNYTFITPNSTTALQTALVDSPVSVVIEADQDVFQFYTSGVIKANCGNSIDHAVLAVGYDKVGVYQAFIVKNSWGTSWGDNGYVFISTNNKANDGTGVCGILTQPVVAQN